MQMLIVRVRGTPMRKRALTLIEVLVSVVILALVMAGMTNLFISGKRYVLHSRARMTGGELGKFFLDPLQMAVRQDTWINPNNPLANGIWYCDDIPAHAGQQHPNCPLLANRTLNAIPYNAQYTINRDSPIANMNRVRVDIVWSESSPQ